MEKLGEIILELRKLANDLDKQGRFKDADVIDQSVMKLARVLLEEKYDVDASPLAGGGGDDGDETDEEFLERIFKDPERLYRGDLLAKE